MAFEHEGRSSGALTPSSGNRQDAGQRSLVLSMIIGDEPLIVKTVRQPSDHAMPFDGMTPSESLEGTGANRYPPCTRELCYSSSGSGRSVFVDYLRVVLPSDGVTWQELLSRVGELAERPLGWQGHYDKSAHVLDGGLVAWCSNKERAERQGVVIDLPGRACAALGDNLVPFMAWCTEAGHVTRLDVAIDDHAELVTFERLHDAIESGALVSKARQARWIIGKNAESAERQGWTLYIGTRKSAAMVRIYDKAAERAAAGAEVGGPWVRVELEAHRKYADALTRAVLDGGPEVALSQIAERIRFCEPSATDTNRRRWPLASWWQQFIGDVEPGGSLVCGEPRKTTVDAMLATVRQQAGPALAAIMLAHGDDTSWLVDLISNGEARLKPKHMAALDAWQAQQKSTKVNVTA